MDQQQIARLKNNIIDQAKCFLEEAGEFYPFGTVITQKGEISPVGAYLGEDDHPASIDVFESLKETLLNKINEGQYLCAAIGIDVLITKKDALSILFIGQDNTDKRYYFYSKDAEGKYVFEEYNEDGC